MYRLLRSLLFRLDAETSHRLTFLLLRAGRVALRARRVDALPTEVMGLRFANPVGLAAGLDKNAEVPDVLARLGFGFVELGTVTPRPQPGNPRPRLFRLVKARAIINRMGFNNAGVERFLANLARHRPRVPVGINIGKNKDTPNERALDDYLAALRAVYAHADYVTVNISSPNTPGLRALQEGGNLERLLAALKAEQRTLAATHGRYVPIALKIAPDLDDEQIGEIARLVAAHGFDAVIATNTTVSRAGVEGEPLAAETGGLSGRPLRERSTEVVRALYRVLRGKVPIIGVGGIGSADDAWEKMVAGANLVQVYTAFIYEGPALIERLIAGLAERVRTSGYTTLHEALSEARRRAQG